MKKWDIFCSCFSFAALSLFGRGTDFQPAKVSGRILSMSVLTFGFMIFVAYNAVLISYLAVRITTPPIPSFDDLLTSKYKLIIFNSEAMFDFFKEAPEDSTSEYFFI